MNLNLPDSELIRFVVIPIIASSLAALAWLYLQTRRSRPADRRHKFRSRYERSRRERLSERKAEAILEVRKKRAERLKSHDLDPMEHKRFSKPNRARTASFCRFPKGRRHRNR
jgi:hypothetical protein